MSHADSPVVDPFLRDEVIAWLVANEFKDYEGHGYYDRVYALSHSYVTMRVGVPPGQICATVSLRDSGRDDSRVVYIGEAYTPAPLAALWGVLSAFDYQWGRDAMYWRDYHQRRHALPEAK